MLQFVGGYLMFFKDFGKCFAESFEFFWGFFFSNLLWWCTNSSARKERGRGASVGEDVWRMGLYSKPCACLFSSPPSCISFHQTIFLITQQKQRQPDFKQHQAAIREPDITLQAGKGHFVNKRERQHIKAKTPPTFPLCSDATDDFRSSSMTLPICWVLLSGASSQQQIRNV